LQPHSKLLTELEKGGIEIAASQSIAEELRPELYLQKIKVKITQNSSLFPPFCFCLAFFLIFIMQNRDKNSLIYIRNAFFMLGLLSFLLRFARIKTFGSFWEISTKYGQEGFSVRYER